MYHPFHSLLTVQFVHERANEPYSETFKWYLPPHRTYLIREGNEKCPRRRTGISMAFSHHNRPPLSPLRRKFRNDNPQLHGVRIIIRKEAPH